ncbi:hypothetical protein M404DRAFT_1007296 [Pisolithus tinctorius Marx 270]|uniref:Secreted protein n=1 Tax=Pisolithus tinctorius Marx 270 TaxID=870435 RepID=A0A0C3N3R8_PISTI|nr:hypothetical protein M404DRAFT_1007296 [Pisolithus tinctorius Marx 270]
MFSMCLFTLLTTIVLLFLCSPAVRKSLIAGDDTLDAHEAGIVFVASRNPIRETGPPACMAKLIMLRHKMQTSTRKRRTPVRQPRNFALNQHPRPRASWVRLGRPFGGKNYH